MSVIRALYKTPEKTALNLRYMAGFTISKMESLKIWTLAMMVSVRTDFAENLSMHKINEA